MDRGLRKRFFVTGTDTEVGKTFSTAAILASLAGKGYRVAGLKPVAAGADARQGSKPCNSDALTLMHNASLELPYEVVNPVLLEAAMAPHIAAEREGRSLSVSRLQGFIQGALTRDYDYVFIEGAGGWLVPLNSRETLADLAATLGIPVVLVVGMRLGCLNHALLTAESIRQRGLELAGWVANAGIDPGFGELEENVNTLKARLGAPCFGVLPRAGSPGDPATQSVLDLTALLPGS